MMYNAATPYCSTGTSHGGNPALGICGKCQDSDGTDGVGGNQGSCTTGMQCCPSGECKALPGAC